MPMKAAASLLSAGMLLAACGGSEQVLASRVVERPSPSNGPMSPLPLKDAATLARGASTAKPVVVTADMRKACGHVQAAMDADRRVIEQETRDFTPVEAEMYAAWEAGRTGSNADFVQSLLEPGSLIDGDTHTLGDAMYRLAVMCDIPIPAVDAHSRCGGRPLPISRLGIEGDSQEQVATSFAREVLQQPIATTRRQSPCELILEPSGTRMIFAAPDGSGRPALTHASSNGDDEALSLQVVDGSLNGNAQAGGCAGCVLEARVVAVQGATSAQVQPRGTSFTVAWPPKWTQRGLLLRVLDDRFLVRSVMFIPIPDGDFAAG